MEPGGNYAYRAIYTSYSLLYTKKISRQRKKSKDNTGGRGEKKISPFQNLGHFVEHINRFLQEMA